MSSSTPSATALGAGARVAGDLHLDHHAVLAGKISGSVHTTAHLELAGDAVIHGDLHAASLTLAGRIAGNVAVQGTTELQLGGVIEGRLDTGHLVVAEGASYEGQLRLRRPADQPTQAKTAPSLTLNRTQPQRASETTEVVQSQTAEAVFNAIPGTVNAGLRPRRRVSNAS